MIIRGQLVQAKTSEQIESITLGLRQQWEIGDAEFFPIVPIAEVYVGDGFEVIPVEDMEKHHGLSFPDLGIMQIREDVYLAACAHDPTARDTIAHELGHMILHSNLFLAQSCKQSIPRLIEDSEWQADEFSKLLLAPTKLVIGRSAVEISKQCGIPLRIAISRIQKQNADRHAAHRRLQTTDN